jgi:hypothetical protein
MASSARPVALARRPALAPRSRARLQMTGTISCSSRVAVNRWRHLPQNSSQRVSKSPSSPLISGSPKPRRH